MAWGEKHRRVAGMFTIATTLLIARAINILATTTPKPPDPNPIGNPSQTFPTLAPTAAETPPRFQLITCVVSLALTDGTLNPKPATLNPKCRTLNAEPQSLKHTSQKTSMKTRVCTSCAGHAPGLWSVL